MSKHWLPDGTLRPYDDAKYYRLEQRPVSSLADLSATLTELEHDPHACVIRGQWVGAEEAERRDAAEYRKGKVRRALAQFDDAPRRWMLVDVDRYEPKRAAAVGDEDAAIAEFVRECLPPEFWGIDCHWQYSSSAGSAGAGRALKLHLWFWLDKAVDSATLTVWAKGRPNVDAAVYRTVQPHYTAGPTFDAGVRDPIARRSGYYEGLAGDVVRLNLSKVSDVAARAARETGGGRHVVLRGIATADAVAARLAELGLVKSQARGGELNIVCPFAELHTGGAAGQDGETSTQYFPAHTHGFRVGNFKCMHAHCDGRPRAVWLARLDLRDEDGEILRGREEGPSAEGFGPVEDDGEAGDEDARTADPTDDEDFWTPVAETVDEVNRSDGSDDEDFWTPIPEPAGGSAPAREERRAVDRSAARATAAESAAAPEVELKSIPQAKHLCTDQANARRLEKKFKSKAFVADGVWHTWDGKRWARDERDVWVMACKLSAIVKAEAAAWLARPAADASEAKVNAAVAAALEKWSTKCEMKGTIEAAVGLVRKILAVDSEKLDSDPWALNCLNGTVDLRTGELREHRAEDYLTKLAPVNFRPELLKLMRNGTVPAEGQAGRLWRRTLAQIMLEVDGWGEAGGPMTEFFQRWAGYCATGSVREQAFCVLHGDGRNGKSTLMEALAAALGDYASSAAPGLLSASKGGDRHPTEIADLRGRRMVTAHETGEGCVLREDFVKQATGGDVMKARVMRGDFFEFRPTHKLQLLTNHKPAIRGQDQGIWRRVMLVPFMARFGDAEAVRAGDAHWERDVGLMARLLERRELEAVLAWIVAGAMEWAANGLRPPEMVLAASRAYRSEQDRIGQFLEECCEVARSVGQAMGVGEAEAARAVKERGIGVREACVTGDAVGPWRAALVLGSGGKGGGLYPAYQAWCRESGVMAQSRQRFLAALEKLVPGYSCPPRELTKVAGVRRWVVYVYGLRLLDIEGEEIED